MDSVQNNPVARPDGALVDDHWVNPREYVSALGSQMRTVLVVEDDGDARELLSGFLTQEGLEVLEAGTVRGALDVLTARDVDVVLLDVLLPDGTGLEVCDAVRQSARRASTSVIMLTALDGPADQAAGVIAGADSYLTKPVTRAELVLRLADVL